MTWTYSDMKLAQATIRERRERHNRDRVLRALGEMR